MKNILLLLLLLWTIPALYSQTVFHKFLTQNNASGYLYRCLQTSDGGYATAGLLMIDTSFDNNFLVAKFNVDGKRIWIKSLGSPDSDEFTDVIETADSGIIAVGTTVNFNTFLSTAVVAKFNSAGLKVWSKTYTLSGMSSTAKKIQKDADGNLYVFGTVEVGGSVNHYYIMKLNSDGNTLQQTTISSTFSDFAISFLRESTGDFVIGGWGNDGTGENIHIIKISSAFSMLWNKYISGSIKLYAYDMKEKSDGNILLAGSYDDGTNPYEALIIEMDNSSGEVVWAKRYSPSNNLGIYAYGLAINSGDRIAITGIVEDFNSGLIAFEVSPAGIVNWSKRITSANELSSVGYGICKSFEGGYVISGSRTGIDNSCFQLLKTTIGGGVQCMGTDLNLADTDVVISSQSIVVTTGSASLTAQDIVYPETVYTTFEDACEPLSVDEQVAENDFSVYPNPSWGNFVVSCNAIQAESSLMMYNASGMLVYRTNSINSPLFEVNLDLQAGIYFLQLNTDGKLLTRKVLIR